MKTITTLILSGMLFCIQPICAQVIIEPTKKELSRALIAIRNAGPENTSIKLHSAASTALMELDYGELSTLTGNNLSEELIQYFNFGTERRGQVLKMPALKAAIIVNHLMTQKIEPVLIREEEIAVHLKEIESAVFRLLEMQKRDMDNLGIKQLGDMLFAARDILKDENPCLHVDTKTINKLQRTIPLAEQWGFKDASKSIELAAVMAANKCRFVDEKKDTDTKVKTKKPGND